MSQIATPRQMEIAKLIDELQISEGYPPTLQGVATRLGINKVTVFEHVAKLRRNHFVCRARKNKIRFLRLTSKGRTAIQNIPPSLSHFERWIGPLSKRQKARLSCGKSASGVKP